MRKPVAIAAGTVLGALALLAGTAGLRPAAFRIERAARVEAPPAQVREELSTPQRWEAWTAWARRGDAAGRVLGGPAAGPGASLYWSEGSAGPGRLTVVRSDAGAVEAELERPGRAPADVAFLLEPEAGGTRVRAAVSGERDLRARMRALLRREDAALAGELEDGLARLGAGLARRAARGWRVERAATLAAPRPAVLEALGDLRRWRAWSPWEGAGVRRSYGGPDRGPGASYYWAEKDGPAALARLTVLRAAGEAVELEVALGSATGDVELRAEPDGEGTRLTWTVSGEADGPGAAPALGRTEEELGRQLEGGLARLAAALQPPPGRSRQVRGSVSSAEP